MQVSKHGFRHCQPYSWVEHCQIIFNNQLNGLISYNFLFKSKCLNDLLVFVQLLQKKIRLSAIGLPEPHQDGSLVSDLQVIIGQLLHSRWMEEGKVTTSQAKLTVGLVFDSSGGNQVILITGSLWVLLTNILARDFQYFL